MAKRTCKGCGDKFEQVRTNQIVCSYECATVYTTKQKEKTKTYSDHIKELQVIVNKYIRLRDKDKPCISCLKPLLNKFDAGHYKSAGGNPELRFNEDNIHGQCVYCNRHLHGNLINYRTNLIKRISEEKVLLLENYNLPLKLSIPEIEEMKKIYKQKIKQLC